MDEIPGQVPTCHECQSMVQIRNKTIYEQSVADTRPKVVQVRVCSNPDCVTNSGERPMGVYV